MLLQNSRKKIKDIKFVMDQSIEGIKWQQQEGPLPQNRGDHRGRTLILSGNLEFQKQFRITRLDSNKDARYFDMNRQQKPNHAEGQEFEIQRGIQRSKRKFIRITSFLILCLLLPLVWTFFVLPRLEIVFQPQHSSQFYKITVQEFSKCSEFEFKLLSNRFIRLWYDKDIVDAFISYHRAMAGEAACDMTCEKYQSDPLNTGLPSKMKLLKAHFRMRSLAELAGLYGTKGLSKLIKCV